jgi:hypothetical protein
LLYAEGTSTSRLSGTSSGTTQTIGGGYGGYTGGFGGGSIGFKNSSISLSGRQQTNLAASLTPPAKKRFNALRYIGLGVLLSVATVMAGCVGIIAYSASQAAAAVNQPRPAAQPQLGTQPHSRTLQRPQRAAPVLQPAPQPPAPAPPPATLSPKATLAIRMFSVGFWVVNLGGWGLIFFAAVRESGRVNEYNNAVWPGLYRRWQQSMLCQRCGLIFERLAAPSTGQPAIHAGEA